jgi:2-polyprenyl-3-methyl-5-hydroxy-6-metoxy-1,4-benzoquinol methylase
MDKSENFWDRMAKKYEKTEKKYEHISLKTVENTKKYLKSSDEVLDYACGPGTKTLELSGLVKEIHGIDISPKMIEIAKRQAVRLKISNVDFSQGIIFDERLERESFDVILGFNILHALEDTQKVMQRINELLKPGGLFISITPCLGEKQTLVNNLQFIPYLLLSTLGLIPLKVKRFKFTELEDLISEGNFQILDTEIIFQRMSSFFIAAKKM